MTSQAFTIRESIHLPESVAAVWDTLVTQQVLQQWLKAKRFVLEIDDSGLIEIPFQREGKALDVLGETSLLYPPQQLIFTWIERDEIGREWMFPTIVVLDFESVSDGSQLTLTHKGFERLPLEERAKILTHYRDYWREKLGELLLVSV